MSEGQQLDRSMLDGKDREELHAIAAAMGVRGATRMRKADLVAAILGEEPAPSAAGVTGSDPGDRVTAAIAASNGAIPEPAGAPRTKRVRSTKPVAEVDDDPVAALAAEEAALDGAASRRVPTDPAPEPASSSEPASASPEPPAASQTPETRADPETTAAAPAPDLGASEPVTASAPERA
ncbi:MAG: transcription termination factor Rho, partial [Actinomycetia bacterium]|nr:transcription termination factor Rho [Actinomycetes bacterium]